MGRVKKSLSEDSGRSSLPTITTNPPRISLNDKAKNFYSALHFTEHMNILWFIWCYS